MKSIKALLTAVLLLVCLGAQSQSKIKPQTVYIFGFAASYTDSVAFLTDVMKVDSATILPNGFLAGRALYSLQLENHVTADKKVMDPTTAIFFSTSLSAARKKYEKINTRYQRSTDLALIYVGEDEFRFTSEAYIPDEAFRDTPQKSQK